MAERVGLLVFSDGTILQGKGLGASHQGTGELVFNTSMTGYQEALTDPSYAGQVLVFSYPLIGNYGISSKALESKRVWAEGVVVSEAALAPHHYESHSTLDAFLQAENVPGIAGLDTRALVHLIRSGGVTPVAIDVVDISEVALRSKQLQAAAKAFDYGNVNFVQKVSVEKTTTFIPETSKRTVVLVDCGAKSSIATNLVQRDCTVHQVPYDTSAKDILALKPDGVMFSNGPGDPEQLHATVKACRDLLGQVPVFGICLGHQVLAQALGAKTFKLKFGHRGSNHAVRDVHTHKVMITAQNHGYAVHKIPSVADEWLVNALDGTNEGLTCDKHDAFSVQFHPEANPGPYDANALFDQFMQKIG